MESGRTVISGIIPMCENKIAALIKSNMAEYIN